MKRLCLPLAVLFLLTACAAPPAAQSPAPTPSPSPAVRPTQAAPDPTPEPPAEEGWRRFGNITTMVRPQNGSYRCVFAEGQYNRADLPTYAFDDTAVFQGAEDLAAELLEAGKNPGLGVRALHGQGITGRGVNVAIIDQNLVGEHPEYAGKIAAYYDSGCGEPAESGSYHGPAVLGILAGETVGVAPGARVYYAAAPSWLQDSAYYADCLYWILEQNEALPESEKIRLVSVSAAPEEGWYSNAGQWTQAVQAAEEAGILVLDCRSQAHTGFVFSAYYDPAAPEDVSKCRPFYPEGAFDGSFDHVDPQAFADTVFAPASCRTLAQELVKGENHYRYEGAGGQSWSVPYAAGVLALGWQVNPDLPADTMKELLLASCYRDGDGLHIIDPAAFIESVRNA